MNNGIIPGFIGGAVAEYLGNDLGNPIVKAIIVTNECLQILSDDLIWIY